MPSSQQSFNRRSVVRTAAWSVPAVTLAAATPAFARSTTPSVAWDARGLALLELGLLNGEPSGGAVVNTTVLPIGAQGFTITNPSGADLTNLTAEVRISYAGGIPLLVCKGFGVYAVSGDPALVTNRTEQYRGIGLIGTYNTTQTLSLPDAGAGSTWVPVTFGLTDEGSLGVSVVVSYDAELVLKSNGIEVGRSTTRLTQPIGLNLLG